MQIRLDFKTPESFELVKSEEELLMQYKYGDTQINRNISEKTKLDINFFLLRF